MSNDLLTAKQVQDEYGVSRSTLLRWEEQGKLNVQRTPGGHRRYDRTFVDDTLARSAIDGALENDPDVGAARAVTYSEFGVSGLKQFGGSVQEERLRELRGRSGRIKKREMRLNDSTLGAMFFGITNAMRQASWRIRPASESAADKKAAEFIESVLFSDMSWDWDTTLALIIEEMLEQGFSLNEIVLKKRLGDTPPQYTRNPAESFYDDGLIGVRKLAPRPAVSLTEGQEWIFDDNGGVLGINQSNLYPAKRSKRPTTIAIPMEKLLLFRTTPHPANNPEGLEIHRNSYVSWWFKTNIQELEGIGVERDLSGIPVVYLGKGTTSTGANSDFELAKSLVVNLRNDEQAGVVIPHPKLNNDGVGMLLELLSTDSRRSYDTSAIVGRYDRAMAMSVLAQFLFLGMSSTGSFALAQYQGDLFTLAITAFLNNISSIFNRHLIPKLIKINPFGNLSGFPELVNGSAGVPSLESFSKFVNEMVGAQVLTPDPELERTVRQMARIPQQTANVSLSSEERMDNLMGRNQPEDEVDESADERDNEQPEPKNESKSTTSVDNSDDDD